MRILLAVETVDFRKGIDGLAGICRGTLKVDPFSGCLFVFRNRRGTSIKILVYDGQGYYLCQKRLSRGRFRWWPKQTEGVSRTLAANQLQTLLWNGDPDKIAVSSEWKKIPATA
jgi:transposase